MLHEVLAVLIGHLTDSCRQTESVFLQLCANMVKKAKGKHRLDKYYNLAKEQG